MKALILSLVIAFSSSFALACTSPNVGFGSKEGALKKGMGTQTLNNTPVRVTLNQGEQVK